MKNLILSFLLLITVSSFAQNNRLESAVQPTCTACSSTILGFKNIWKVDEMFINEVPVKDSIAYQVRFVFGEENNLVICYDHSSANMFQWDYVQSTNAIIFWNHNRTRKLDEFILDSISPFVMILKSNKKDKYTNADSVVEYRLLPDNAFVIPSDIITGSN